MAEDRRIAPQNAGRLLRGYSDEVNKLMQVSNPATSPVSEKTFPSRGYLASAGHLPHNDGLMKDTGSQH